MSFIAGIDGGGTKTRVRGRYADGSAPPEREFGAFNLNGMGAERFAATLEEVAAYLSSLGDCEALCIGSAGIGNREMSRLVAAALARAGIANWKLVGDEEIALEGALDGQPGVVVIAGTGSVCFGRDAAGNTARVGGWGHLLGDGGSGYALGRDAIAAAARDRDGCGEPTLLTRLLAERGLDSRETIVSYVYGGEKADVARLSFLTEEAAGKGDAVARGIIEKNAAELALLADTAAKKLDLPDARIAMLGGLLEHETAFKAAFLRAMQARAPALRCMAPIRDACDGAVLLAAKMREETFS